MSNHQRFSVLFRLLTAFVIASMLIAPLASSVQAKTTFPPREKPEILVPVSLEEAKQAGLLRDPNAEVSLVLELRDAPAALVYAESFSNGPDKAVTDSMAQIKRIETAQKNVLSAIRTQGITYKEIYRVQRAYNGIWLRVKGSDVSALAAIKGVKAIHSVIHKELDHTTSVPLIGALQAWAGSGAYQGDGVKVAIIDSGIDYVHTNFGGPGVYTGQDFTTLSETGNLFPTAKVVGGYDFAGDGYDANGASGSITPTPDPDPMDCGGHGSHVSGSVAGFGVLQDGSTYTETSGDTYADLAALSTSAYQTKFRIGPGVAPKALLYSLRVFGCDGSTDLTEQAIDWALDPNGDGNMSDHLDVINMSLGSSYGSEYDTSAIASNNAAQMGIIVVASAGNSGDVNYITGSPSVARNVISVASTVDEGAVVSGFDINSAPSLTPGTYPAVEAGFGPAIGTFSVTGDLALSTPANGCGTAALTGVSGKIALIDRGSCTFQEKVTNAEAGGAIGVLVANNLAGFPFTMAGAGSTIPAMMTSLSMGNSLKADMGSGVVNVTLSDAHRDALLLVDPTYLDTVSSFSSRGLARVDSRLKPDVAAPGDTIYSTAVGTGNQGVSFSGTSMSSPHVAGTMALLRQAYPTWSVAELKALLMNTANTNVWGDTAHTIQHTPSRIGSGRISIPDALNSDVVVYNAGDPGQVSVSFGQVNVFASQTFSKVVRLQNKTATSHDYTVGFDSRYAANPGVIFTFTDAALGGSDLTGSTITVPANGSFDVLVQVAVNPALLTKSLDPTLSTASGRQRFAESGGYLTFAGVGGAANLHLPVYIAPRPASVMSISESNITLDPAPTGSVFLTPTGLPVSDSYGGLGLPSLADVYNLTYTSPNEVYSAGPSNAADLKYVGVEFDPYYSMLYIGVATQGKWDTPSPYSVEFDVYFDTNQDGVDDFVMYNYDSGFGTSTRTDTFYTILCSLVTSKCAASYLNDWSGSVTTNVFDNNVLTLPLDPFYSSASFPTPLLGSGDTDFAYHIVTFSREFPGVVDSTPVMYYDINKQAFSGTYGITQLDDPAAGQWEITYDRNEAASSQGLLVLHHSNQAGSSAEVIPVEIASVVSSTINPATPVISTDTAVFTVTFSLPVTGVDVNDFMIAQSGGMGGYTVNAVSGAGNVYQVTIGTGSGNGTLRLDIPDTATIYDMSGNLVGGALPFTDGESYTVLKSALSALADFNGDGKTDIAYFNPTELPNASFHVYTGSSTPEVVKPFGQNGDTPVPADYNGDGKAEYAVFRPTAGKWFIAGSGNPAGFSYGTNGDVPVPADYNGDGKVDIAVFRPSNGNWLIRGVGLAASAFGQSGDIPVPGDYNSDGRADFAIFRPSDGSWRVKGIGVFMLGAAGDIPVPGDYNGDGKVEPAVFRPSTGTWYIYGPVTQEVSFGTAGDIPLALRYSSSARAQIAVFRPSTGQWIIRGAGAVTFGSGAVVPAAPVQQP